MQQTELRERDLVPPVDMQQTDLRERDLVPPVDMQQTELCEGDLVPPVDMQQTERRPVDSTNCTSPAVTAVPAPNMNTTAQSNQQRRRSATLRLSMRPISTPVNVLVTGGSLLGKTSFISNWCSALSDYCSDSSSSGSSRATSSGGDGPGRPVGPSSNKQSTGGSSAGEGGSIHWPEPTSLKPILVPVACREMKYTFQETPGHGCTLEHAGHLKTLITYILQQLEKDYKLLDGSKSMHKSLACGCLEHSISLCLYFLPPHGPSQLDLVMMAHLSQYVALVPVVAKADCMTAEEAKMCVEAVNKLLKVPGVADVPPLNAYGVSKGITLPILLSNRVPDDDATDPGLKSIMRILCEDEVYRLLDAAWDQYTLFCSNYENDGKTLDSMLDNASKNIAKVLAGRTELLQAAEDEIANLQDDLRQVMATLPGLVQSLEAQLQAAKKDEVDLEKLFEVFKSYRLGMGHAQYDDRSINNSSRKTYRVSNYLSAPTQVPQELIERFPDYNW